MVATNLVDRLDQPVVEAMRREFARISVRQTVGEALAQVQQSRIEGPVIYFYALDDEGRLQGVVPTRGLLLNPADTPVEQVMVRRVVTLPDTATLMEACELFIMHRLMALPVVDRQKRMIGIVDVSVYTEEMSDLASREASDGVFKLIGVRLKEVKRGSVGTHFHRRFPWLLCNVAGGLACAFLAHGFHELLQEAIVLTLFFPVMLALAESVSIQSLTLTFQTQHEGLWTWRRFALAMAREVPVGLMLGAGAGAIVALVAGFWAGFWRLPLCIFAAITLSAGTAAALGLAVPLLVWAARRDAKLASGPIVLATADVLTLFYFLGLASLVLR